MKRSTITRRSALRPLGIRGRKDREQLGAIRCTSDKFSYGPRGRQTFAYFWAVIRNKIASAYGGESP